jgi:hypothetical protein
MPSRHSALEEQAHVPNTQSRVAKNPADFLIFGNVLKTMLV